VANAAYQSRNLKHNYLVNLLDGGFFGFALGFASISTIIPLFVSNFTSSAILIGLIPAILNMGWQFPQLFLARAVSRLTHYKPMTMLYTIHERIPFLALALVAWFSPMLGKTLSLVLIFVCLIWQGLGGGFTANAWQNMIVRVFPSNARATFFGAQSAAANLLASVGAIGAGFILAKLPSPLNFTLCFIFTSVLMGVSYVFLGYTREPDRLEGLDHTPESLPFWSAVRIILKEDASFRWYIVSKMLTQVAMLASAFYTIYAVRHHGMNVATAGIMTSVLLITIVVANPIIGWLADHWDRKAILEFGAGGLIISPIIAWLAPTLGWFFVVMVVWGFSSAIIATLGIAFVLEYGNEARRPTYIGLANTLITPVTIAAPFIGGWLADTAGFQSTFMVASTAGVFTLLVLHFFVTDPRKQKFVSINPETEIQSGL